MKQELKEKLHQLIDELDNEAALNILHEEAVAYISQKDIVDDLTPVQLAELEEAIAEADRGEGLIEWSEFKQQMKQWKEK